MTFREMYLVVRRSAWLVMATSILAMIVTLAVSWLAQKEYTSQAAVSLTVSTQMASLPFANVQLLSNMPPVPGLAQAFVQQVASHASAKALGLEAPEGAFEARFDERKALLSLVATGSTPTECRERALRLVRVSEDYFLGRIVAVTTDTLKGAAALAKLDLATADANLRDVQGMLKPGGRPTPPVTPEVSAALEAFKVDPRVARSPNPGYTYLALEEAVLQAQLARSQARARALEGLLSDPRALLELTRQSFHIEVLASPVKPLQPSSPRPVRNTALAGLFGLTAGVFGAFVRAALVPPGSEAMSELSQSRVG